MKHPKSSPSLRFAPVSHDVLDSLRTIVGEAHVSVEPARLEEFSRDETEDLRFPPEVAVFPNNAEQISEILKLASFLKIPVTPRGAGTGLSGGALPIYGGIVMSLIRMNRIIEIDTRNLVVVTEPGVITQRLQEAVEAEGLFYPVDPASRGSCLIGGNVAENSGGPRAAKYGVTKDYVLGLTAVMPSGEIITSGGKLYKDVTGYNLTQILVGSEGTLAVITEIVLKLLPLPKARQMALIPFPTLEQPAQMVSEIMRAGVIPSALEFMERDAILCVKERMGRTVPHDDAAAHLLVELDGPSAEAISIQMDTIGELALAGGAIDVLIAESKDKMEDLWKIRRSMGEAVKKRSVYKEEDTVVPRDQIPALLREVKSLCSRWGITSVCYGHAGDGNIHVNLLKEQLPDKIWEEKLPEMVTELFQIVKGLGGTLTGEHGVGYSQKEYLPLVKSPAEINLMRRLKAAFDPDGILNPGKIFPAKESE